MPTYCEACHRTYKQIKPHLKTKKHTKNTLLLQEPQPGPQPQQEIHECSVCLDEISSNKLHTTQCGHHFHRDCINNWRRMKNNCPNCRGVLPPLPRQQVVIGEERRANALEAARRAAARRAAARRAAVAARQAAVFGVFARQVAAEERRVAAVQPNYHLINTLLETINIFERFENMDEDILNDARHRLMQLLN